MLGIARNAPADLARLALKHFRRRAAKGAHPQVPCLLRRRHALRAAGPTSLGEGDPGQLFPRLVYEEDAALAVEQENRLVRALEEALPAEISRVHGRLVRRRRPWPLTTDEIR